MTSWELISFSTRTLLHAVSSGTHYNTVLTHSLNFLNSLLTWVIVQGRKLLSYFIQTLRKYIIIWICEDIIYSPIFKQVLLDTCKNNDKKTTSMKCLLCQNFHSLQTTTICLEQQNIKGWALSEPSTLAVIKLLCGPLAHSFSSAASCTKCSTLLTEMSSKSPGLITWWPRCLNLNVAKV